MNREQGEDKLGYDPSLTPLANFRDIMNDMSTKALDWGLREAIEVLDGRVIRVGTMCSGTDSPILGLQQVSKYLREVFNKNLVFEHVFSCEIAVNKAAFIRRNTGINMIFRDVRQMAFNDLASTHYGAARKVPSDLDVVIAGFSCVDFSAMNPHPKKITELGESADTFEAVRLFAKNNNPKFLILENIVLAPWKEFIQPAFQPAQKKTADGSPIPDTYWDGHPGYAAVSGIFDTMDFYLPQSRNRGYMILVNRKYYPNADKLAEDWFPLMQKLQRKASVPAEAFFLNADDSRLQKAQESIIRDGRTGAKRTVVDWVLSAVRHERYRRENNLGTSRPILKWTEGGMCEPRDFTWITWIRRQVDRIKDTIEINTLRNVAARGFDSEYKLRVWNLSQNIDRDLDKTRWGIVQCLTPTGIYYNTLRGGPMVGIECLSLQGLPIEEMLLSRETDKELVDLAGNAMSSTVVAAAVISGIIILASRLGTSTANQPTKKEAVSKSMGEGWLQARRILDLGQLDYADEQMETVKDLLHFADQSVLLCECEGQSQVTKRPLRVCLECSFSSCSRCGGNPAHQYGPYGDNIVSSRRSPQEFRSMLTQVLPMRIFLEGLIIDPLLSAAIARNIITSESWRPFKKLLYDACDREFKFYATKRTHCWTVTYKAPYSRLELIIGKNEAKWLLFVKPDPKEAGTSKIRELLKYPIARMLVEGEAVRQGILEGVWELRLPTDHKNELRISPSKTSKLIPVWESTLGLKDPKFQNKQVWDEVKIENSFKSINDDAISTITGVFKRLPTCSTAYNSLYKRVTPDTEKPLFFFLDPFRYGESDLDPYVFSTEKQRLDFGEQRDIIASLDPSWRPSHEQVSEVEGTTLATWITVSGCLTTAAPRPAPTYAVLKQNVVPDVSFKNHDCNMSCTAIMSLAAELDFEDLNIWVWGEWATVSPTRLNSVSSELLYAIIRMRTLDGFSPDWRPLGVPDLLHLCKLCAPAEPKLRWESKTKSDVQNAKTYRVEPYEDEDQAFQYEEAMTRSPSPFLVQTRINAQGQGCLQIGLNVANLLHRALAQLKRPRVAPTKGLSAQWRLVTNHSEHKLTIPKFFLKDNYRLRDRPYKHIFKDPSTERKGPYQLRSDQMRSVRWMKRREDPSRATYVLSETVEAIIEQFGWRGEVTVKQDKEVLGGLCSDQVGYGKTAITLALIDSTIDDACKFAAEDFPGKLPLKATLIVVPLTLCAQWAQQVVKFLGEKYVVLVVTSWNQWKALTVRRMREADIIILSWTLFEKNTYTEATAYLGTVPPGPDMSGRSFESWLAYALDRMSSNVDDLKNAEKSSRSNKMKEYGARLNQALRDARKDKTLIRSFPVTRKRGKDYESGLVSFDDRQRAEAAKIQDTCDLFERFANENERISPFNLNNADSVNDCKGLPFHAYEFHRLVLDEHTYVQDKLLSYVASLSATRRWILSGTPPLTNFYELQQCFALLGVTLGIEDDNIASMSANAIKKFRSSRTSAEIFRAFDVRRSTVWHERRNLHAQNTLHLLARQNKVPVNIRIPLREIVVAVTLSPVEKVAYREFHQELFANGMVAEKEIGAIDEPENAKQQIVKQCESGPEALLRCASTLPYLEPEIEGRTTATLQIPYIGNYVAPTTMAVAEALLRYRNSRAAKLLLSAFMCIKRAFWLRNQIPSATYDQDETHWRDLKQHIRDNRFGGGKIGQLLNKLLVWAEAESYHDRGESYFMTSADRDKAYETVRYAEDMNKPLWQQAAQDASDKFHGRGAGKKLDWAVHPPLQLHQIERDLPKELFPAPGKPTETRLRFECGQIRKYLRWWLEAYMAHCFFQSAVNLQIWNLYRLDNRTAKRNEHKQKCAACKKEAKDPEDIVVLGVCGHLACSQCLNKEEDVAHCPQQDCKQSAASLYKHSAASLGIFEDRELKSSSKIDAVVATIKSICEEEQVLVFVQYQLIGELMERALEKEGIKFYSLLEKHEKRKAAAMENFKNNSRTTDPGYRQVMILNSSTESAAGA